MPLPLSPPLSPPSPRLLRAALERRRTRHPVSDHCDGARFHNAVRQPRFAARMAWWALTRRPAPWPRWVDLPVQPPPPSRVGPGELRVTFVHHATVLVQMEGLNVLTDPVWSERASPVPFAGPWRRHRPGIALEHLPPIDVVLVSHDHYDHMDLATLKAIEARHRPLVVTSLGNGPRLQRRGLRRVVELDWWHERPLGPGLDVVCVPAQHFSCRGLFDRDRTLWAGFVLRSRAGPVLFAGDTGDGPHIDDIARAFGPFRLALLPIGAYRPRRLLEAMHMSPAEAVDAAQRLAAQASVAMHFGTFPLSDEARDEPLRDLDTALRRAGLAPSRFWALGCGEGREVPPLARTLRVVSPLPAHEPATVARLAQVAGPHRRVAPARVPSLYGLRR